MMTGQTDVRRRCERLFFVYDCNTTNVNRVLGLHSVIYVATFDLVARVPALDSQVAVSALLLVTLVLLGPVEFIVMAQASSALWDRLAGRYPRFHALRRGDGGGGKPLAPGGAARGVG